MASSGVNQVARGGESPASARPVDSSAAPFPSPANSSASGARGNVTPPGALRTLLNTDGNDTFAIDQSDFGTTTIVAATGGSNLQADIVRFGEGIDPAHLHFTRSGADLHISLLSVGRGPVNSLAGSQDLIIQDFFLTGSAIDAFVFDDGSAILGATLFQRLLPDTVFMESTPTPDGGHRDIVFDGAQSEPWTAGLSDYDASGTLLTQTLFLDIGTVNGTVYDPAGHTLTGGAGVDALNGGDGNDTLQGGAGSDLMQGGSGDDVLDGGAGGDLMVGGTGNDTYHVDSLGDFVVERANEGVDAVYVSVTGFVLPNNVENGLIAITHGLTLTGNGLDNVLQGNVGDDVLIGGAGNDLLVGGAGRDGLVGGAGNDALDGGPGTDRMVGGAGNDSYYVDDLADIVVENPNEGTDAVFVSVNGYTLPDNVENGVITNPDGIALTGNALDNNLEGNVGDDTLTGGAGNDTFIFRRGYAHDTIADFHDGAGPSDTIALSGFDDIKNFADVLAHATQVGADTVIDFGGGDQLTLKDVLKAGLVADDFRFI